jgi:flagellar motor switch protein FliM
MKVEPYNFRNPPPLAGDVGRALTAWLQAAAAKMALRWPRHLSFSAQVRVGPPELTLPGTWLPRQPETAVGLQLALGGVQRPSLLVLPRPLALALLSGLAGDTVDAVPEDRDLTAVEASLCDYLGQALFLNVFEETWPGTGAVALAVGPREANVRSSRLFPPGEAVILCSFTVAAPFGEMASSWVLPRGDWLNRLRTGDAVPAAVRQDGPAQLVSLVQEFPVDLSVTLGTAEVSLVQLARLRAGDLVLLGQRVSEPLTVSVAGAGTFRVWPGAVGPRQAVEIESNLGE